MSNRERLNELLAGQIEILPAVHDILAEHHISDISYAKVFQLLYSASACEGSKVSFCNGTQEWKMGKRSLSDARLFCLLGNVCDVIHSYVLASWEECIFSAWSSDKEVLKVEREMDEMENLTHLRSILKLAAPNMLFSSDGTIDWTGVDSEDIAENTI